MVPKGKHTWLSQQQTLSKIKADMKKNKIHPEDLSKEEIVEFLDNDEWPIEINRNSLLARVLLQSTRGKGYGLFAWEDIEKDEGLGEYAGEILPNKTNAPDEDYGTSIAIGLDVTDEDKAYVDSTKTGSLSRFLNHSCNPNCELLEGRVGGHARIVTVITSRDIKSGEELTIDYGSGWFETFKEQCRCGEASCRNPPRALQRKAGNNGTRDGKGKKHGLEPTNADDTERPQKKRRH